MDSRLAPLQDKIRQLEQSGPKAQAACIPFCCSPLDAHLPGGGLCTGGLHEIASANGLPSEAAATEFTAGILAHMQGPIVWCAKNQDLFAPALAFVGLDPSRIIFVDAGDDKNLLIAMEDSLRYGELAAVVGEVTQLSIVASRRLHLAARMSGVTAFALYRQSHYQKKETKEPTASLTRWRITSLPSDDLPVAGIGRANWLVELTRCRDAECASWRLGACDEKGYLGLSSDLAYRPAATWGQHATA